MKSTLSFWLSPRSNIVILCDECASVIVDDEWTLVGNVPTNGDFVCDNCETRGVVLDPTTPGTLEHEHA